jgi:hypothetical protein
MATTTHPEKEIVRSWLADRRTAGAPPPTPEQIKIELGWRLVGAVDPNGTTR